MPRSLVAVSLAFFSFTAVAQKQSTQDALVHLNQIQVIGTHNSYNTGFAPSEAKYFQEHYAKAYQRTRRLSALRSRKVCLPIRTSIPTATCGSQASRRCILAT